MIREHVRTLPELAIAIRVSEDVLVGWQAAGMPVTPNGFHIRKVLEWARRRGLIRLIKTPSMTEPGLEEKLFRPTFGPMTRRRFTRKTNG
ncbi:MAG: hypothetical protein KDA91_14870 [Planctomycetaceae bacterium]|nr:hypothetical protein [Planctomycetaceae bacterium]